MKKTAILTLLILLVLALSLSLLACAARRSSSTETETASETALGTLEADTHFAATELPTEAITETEPLTVTETEQLTEPAPPTPAGTLRFISYGNGTCGVSGIGSCTDLFVVIPRRSPEGEVVTAIEEKAFYGNRDIKAVEIPSTVSSIGPLAFGDCPSLVYISVDKSNKSFTDIGGVLYTADQSSLLLFPAASGKSTVEISESVTAIADMAFYGCAGLEVILYGGTLADWGQIRIGHSNNGLYTASVSCTAEK